MDLNKIYSYVIAGLLITMGVVYFKTEYTRAQKKVKLLTSQIELKDSKIVELRNTINISNTKIDEQNKKIDELATLNKEIEASKNKAYIKIALMKKETSNKVELIQNKKLVNTDDACNEANKLFDEFRK